MKLSLTGKIFLAFSFTLGTFALIAFWSVREFQALGEGLSNINEGHLALARLAGQLETHQDNRFRDLRRVIDEPQPQNRAVILRIAGAYFPEVIAATAGQIGEVCDRQIRRNKRGPQRTFHEWVARHVGAIGNRHERLDELTDEMLIRTTTATSSDDLVVQIRDLESQLRGDLYQLNKKIDDETDRCPDEPEDQDQFQDEDGCPEPDNDGDGIPDSADLCPNAAEELNGIDDNDGCPEQDSDGDGVYDDRDQCPDKQEDLDGYEDNDGCPDEDNDADGISDKLDACPNDPEDGDGWEDGDGCPDFDNDEDGLPDATDTCPNKEEDEDGFEDMDGCPDLDNDQDGVLDLDDRCPNHPETINGFEDEDGCPDEIPEELKKFTGVIPNIGFKLNSDELLSSSFPTLDQAARVLQEYSGVRLEIQGHASSEGDDDYNQELSQRRAESVRRYLIGRGVENWRLSAVGYGELQPISTNKTESGRSDNRRVEFHLVQPE